ncbi:MAG: hypothetical protein MUF66_08310 [Gammaproteobacteria bacterium]|nr:hypothetical protein [Gammaproteobacteria bacterium]
MTRYPRSSAPRPALTLFLPGLGEPPADGPAEALLGDLSLPALIRVMTRGDRVDGPSGGVERALFSMFGIDTSDGLPAAAVSRLAEDRPLEPGPERVRPEGAPTVSAPGPSEGGAAARRGWWLRADPVHLRPDLSKLILFDAGSFALAEAEAAALAAEVAPLFAEAGAVLEVGTPSRWYLRLDAPLDLQTSPLSAVLGQDLRGHRPAGVDARRWQALLTEVQMTLFASPVNQAREARGELPVNSLWPWGGGRLTEPSTPRWSHVWAEDALAAGLARFSGVPCSPSPASAYDWLVAAQAASAGPAPRAGGAGHVLVDAGLWRAARYGDVEEWRAGLQAIERHWLAPLVEAMGARRLASLTVQGGAGSGHRLDRRGLRRWWRRSRPVASMLGR